MGLRNTLLPEFSIETTTTRKLIERIPEDKLTWKPYENSMDFIGLATHLSNIPTWTNIIINRDSFDLAPDSEERPKVKLASCVKEALEIFDRNVTSAEEEIAGCLDHHLMESWTLLSGGNPIFMLAKISVIRSMVMNHLIHHRAQLGVYLRLNKILVPALFPVPGVYGPIKYGK